MHHKYFHFGLLIPSVYTGTTLLVNSRLLLKAVKTQQVSRAVGVVNVQLLFPARPHVRLIYVRAHVVVLFSFLHRMLLPFFIGHN